MLAYSLVSRVSPVHDSHLGGGLFIIRLLYIKFGLGMARLG